MKPPSHRRLVAAVVTGTAAIALAGGCAIQPDGAPRDIPEDHPARLEANQDDPAGGEARGSDHIYLLAPEDSEAVLRTVRRQTNGDPEVLLRELVSGPNAAEFSDGLRSDVPDDLEILNVRVNDGVVEVDVSDDIIDASLSGTELTRAIAQVVFTASEIQGAEQVLIRVEGAARAWPNGSEQEQRGPLTVYDFIGYAESAQPPYPATPTPTTTPTPSTTAIDAPTTAPAATTTIP